MSRSKHPKGGSRQKVSPDREYWSRRSTSKPGKILQQPGRWTKIMTHRKERRAAKQWDV